MGNFYVNFATRGPRQPAVADCLRSAERKAYVSPTIADVTVFFDEASDAQDEATIADLGKHSSKALTAPVLAVLNHDDDVFLYWLFEAGQVVDEYNSCPGYFGEGEDEPAGGDAGRLCAAFGVPEKAQQVEAILRGGAYAFALERHEALAQLLNQPWPLVCMGYAYIDQDSLADGINKQDMVHIGG